ncbi:MAG: PDZ domain-containing protein [Ruminococcaceae bacterium]|nr:PDZ domain-containing protein [Oscillospiraceae bacterium]
MEFEKYENPENIENTENTENTEENKPFESTFRTDYYQEPVVNPEVSAAASEPVYEPYAEAIPNPGQSNAYQYFYQPVQSEIPPQKPKGNGGKVALRVLSIVLAFAIGAGAATWLSFLALPRLVEKEVQQHQKGNPNAYLAPPNPAMTAEEAGNPNQADKQLLSVVEISRKVGPAVVGIDTTVERQNIFGTSAMGSGSGSGIILSNDGYIVTNNHVIEGASTIKVTLSDGTQYDATLVGGDARTDLAVIKIEGEGFPAATLGNSSELQVGELAVAIGNPLGNELAGSVTGGYISALNRSITVDDREFNLIQTDAAINPGNSGGALVNNYGEVIGINSVKMSASGVEGIGFAIPIDEAKPIIDALIEHGYVAGRPVIGIAGRDVTEQDSIYYDIPVGIYVVETSPYSAAERAGIKTGDVITAIDGVKITTVDELNTEKEKHQAGETVVLTVIRGTETKQISLTLQEDKPVMEAN